MKRPGRQLGRELAALDFSPLCTRGIAQLISN